MIKQIKFVSVPVADQDRALDFYTEKLGFTIITDQPFDEKQRWIELRVPKAETRVVLFTTDDDKGRIGTFMNMSYTCDNLQKTYEELKKRGVEFENPPKKEHWGNFAIFKDSEGNRFVAWHMGMAMEKNVAIEGRLAGRRRNMLQAEPDPISR